VSRIAAIVAPVLALLPDVARACAVCGAAADDDGSRIAYLITGLSLSALPLALFGGFVLWLRTQHRRRNREERPSEALSAPRPHLPTP
jgi:hypothetical protein